MPGRTLLYGYSTKPGLPVPNQEELEKPWTGGILDQVRTGKVRRLYNLPVSSAIYKNPHKEPVKVTFLGIEGDDTITSITAVLTKPFINTAHLTTRSGRPNTLRAHIASLSEGLERIS